MLQHIKTFFDRHLALDGDDETDERPLQLAVAALLLEMTLTDGAVDSGEQAAVEAAVRARFELNDAEAAELLELAGNKNTDATDYYQFTSLINKNYSGEQKIGLVEELWRIAYADDVLHSYEEHMVRKVADLLHVEHAAFIAAKHRAAR